MEQELKRLGRRYQRRLALTVQTKAELDAAIIAARTAGLSLRRIASLTGLSYARIYQIEKESSDGG